MTDSAISPAGAEVSKWAPAVVGFLFASPRPQDDSPEYAFAVLDIFLNRVG